MIVTKLHVWVNPVVLSRVEREKLADKMTPVEIVYEPDEFDGHYYESDTHDIVVWKDEREVSRIVRGMYARVELMEHDDSGPDEKLGGEPVSEPVPDEFYGDQSDAEAEFADQGASEATPSPYERFRHPLTEGEVTMPPEAGEVLHRRSDDAATQLMPVVPPDADATQLLHPSIPDLGAPRELFQYWPGVGRHHRDLVWLRLW